MLRVFAGDPLVNVGFDVGSARVFSGVGGHFFSDEGIFSPFLPYPGYPFLSADLSFVLSPGGDFAEVRGHASLIGQAPEPASMALVGLGLTACGWRLRRRTATL
jgi:hypothetical protein